MYRISSYFRGITYQQTPWHCFPLHCAPDIKFLSLPVHISDLTVPQILLLRKLSLLKLTTVMEKFSPSSRTGWSWGVSKFILDRIRNPDYKGKAYFILFFKKYILLAKTPIFRTSKYNVNKFQRDSNSFLFPIVFHCKNKDRQDCL